MKCADCVHLEDAFQRGRSMATCASLGELPGNESCPDFYAITAPGKHGPHFEIDYNSVFMNIITEIFEIQKASDITVETVKIQLQQQGYTLDFDPKFYISALTKTTELITMHKLLLGLGLAHYEDEIMSYLIADRFGRRDLPSTALQQMQAQKNQQMSGSDALGNMQAGLKDDVHSAVSAALENLKATIK